MTGAGYEKLIKSDLYFYVHVSHPDYLSFAPEFVEIIAESEADVRKWMKARKPEYIIHSIELIHQHKSPPQPSPEHRKEIGQEFEGEGAGFRIR